MILIQISEGTAARRRIPFVCIDDATGGFKTGQTFASTDIMIGKNGVAEAAFLGTSTEKAGGLYIYEFTSAEVNTFGPITLRLNKTGVVKNTFFAQVITHDPYGNVSANVTSINGSTTTAIALKKIYDSCATGTIEVTPVAPTNAAGVCTFQAVMDAPWTEQTADHFNGRLALFLTGVMQGSVMRVNDYAWDAGNSQGIFTGGQMQELPVDGTAFIVL